MRTLSMFLFVFGLLGLTQSRVFAEKTGPIQEKSYAPNGEYFEADKLTVFNIIIAFTTGQPSGDWVKATHRYADGRRSMKALRDPFAGEGNATRNISEADRLKESLH